MVGFVLRMMNFRTVKYRLHDNDFVGVIFFLLCAQFDLRKCARYGDILGHL